MHEKQCILVQLLVIAVCMREQCKMFFLVPNTPLNTTKKDNVILLICTSLRQFYVWCIVFIGWCQEYLRYFQP